MNLLIMTSSTTSTLAGILEMGTEVVGWFISTMTSYLGFITGNPIILIFFLLLLAGAGIGFLFRIWHSA